VFYAQRCIEIGCIIGYKDLVSLLTKTNKINKKRFTMNVIDVKHFGGIDLHSNNAVLVIIDQAKRWVFRGRLKNDLSLILESLSKFRDTLVEIAVESTYNRYVMAAGGWLDGQWLQGASGSSG
jgi:hypothetical protein